MFVLLGIFYLLHYFRMPNAIGHLIKDYRLKSGKSQMIIECEIGLSLGMLSRIESGKVNPTKETILKIAKSLELDPVETAKLFGINVQELY